MQKFTEIQFKVINQKTVNFMRVYKHSDPKNNNIPVWIKCGLSGKQIIWSQPNEQGVGIYRNAIIELSRLTDLATGQKAFVPYAKLVFSKNILSCTNGTQGTLVVNDGNSWTAEFQGCRLVEIGSLLRASVLVA